MFYGYLNDTTVASGDTFVFTKKYLTNNNIFDVNGVYSITVPGWYKIHFDISGSANNTNIIPTLYVNNIASQYAMTEIGSGADDNYVSGSFDTIIHVISIPVDGYATVSVINAGGDANIVSSNFIIERIG